MNLRASELTGSVRDLTIETWVSILGTTYQTYAKWRKGYALSRRSQIQVCKALGFLSHSKCAQCGGSIGAYCQGKHGGQLAAPHPDWTREGIRIYE